MRLLSKPALTVILTVLVIVAGFFFLLRGCLAKYDERSALPQVLYFEKDGKELVFSIVKFEKATSYSRQGNMVRKSVSTNYFIQANDAITGKKISDKEIKHQRDIKNYPIRIMGASENNAWIFLGEVMAFDPFTLEKKADIEILEQKNPSAKGKFPAEERYYLFNRNDGNIYFTAIDGNPWKIDTKTLLVSPGENEAAFPGEEKELAAIEKLIQQNQADQDNLLQEKLRNPSKMLQAKEISMNEYKKMTEGYHEARTILYRIRDSLNELKLKLGKKVRTGEEIKRKIESLSESSGTHYSQIKTNQDTLNGKWYGLYSKEEMEKLYNRLQNQAVYDEKARRQLFTTSFSPDKYGDFMIDKDNATPTSSLYFLDGGLLINRNTSSSLQLNGNAFLVCYKNRIGNEGLIQLAKLTADGKQLWTFDTGLKEWGSYLFTGKQLIITGTNNKELSSSDCNLLLCLDLDKGTAVTYDFFSDK